MNNFNPDKNWRLENNPRFLFLTSDVGQILITSDSITCSEITLTITSCGLPKKINITANGKLVFSGLIQPNIFSKVIFRTLMTEGTNILNFFFITNNDSLQRESKLPISTDIIGIKDFIITSEIFRRFL